MISVSVHKLDLQVVSSVHNNDDVKTWIYGLGVSDPGTNFLEILL